MRLSHSLFLDSVKANECAARCAHFTSVLDRVDQTSKRLNATVVVVVVVVVVLLSCFRFCPLVFSFVCAYPTTRYPKTWRRSHLFGWLELVIPVILLWLFAEPISHLNHISWQVSDVPTFRPSGPTSEKDASNISFSQSTPSVPYSRLIARHFWP